VHAPQRIASSPKAPDPTTLDSLAIRRFHGQPVACSGQETLEELYSRKPLRFR
jgi:hypothetical protein